LPRGSPRLHREDASHRSLQPTLDPSTRISTDSRARSSRCEVRLRDEPRALAPCHPERGVRPPCGNPTPGGSALDGASPASDEPPASLLKLTRRRRAPRAGRASLAGRYQPRRGPVIRPLTPHVAPRDHPLLSDREAPGPLLPPSRQRGRLPRSEAPSIDKCSPPRFRGREPATVPTTSPPRAGFRRFFAPLGCSRREELDPGGGDGLFTRGRLDRAPLANFCNRNEMRAQLLDRSSPAHRAKVAFCAALAAGGRSPFRSSASRDFTGQGRLVVNHTRASSYHDRSRRKLNPNPIGSGTSCHKPASAGGWSSLRRRCALSIEGHPQARLARPRFRGTLPFRAASHASPRREAHYAAPEVPSIDRPTPERVRARPAHSLLPERGEAESRRLFIHCAFLCL
jgi:hypothetical protein